VAGHSGARKLQAGHTDPLVSARQAASVPIKVLHSTRPGNYMAASTLRCTSLADRTVYLDIVSALTVGSHLLLLDQRCSTLCQMIYKIPQSAQQPLDNR